MALILNNFIYGRSTYNANTGPQTVAIHKYSNLDDDFATISASAYFNDILGDQESRTADVTRPVQVGDIILVQASDQVDFLLITAISPDVTTEALITAGDIPDGSITEPKIAPNSLTGTVSANMATGNVIGNIGLIHQVTTAGGATADTDVILTHKSMVIDAWVINKGLGTTGDTITIKNGADAITDAIDIDKADQTKTGALTFNDAFSTIAAGGTLRITETDGGGADSPSVDVFVLVARVA